MTQELITFRQYYWSIHLTSPLRYIYTVKERFSRKQSTEYSL